MKLKLSVLFGQRDPRWNNVLLGYNTQALYTIGLYGCLITTFGNYIGKTPIEVNDILKANSGFVSGSGELVWSAVSSLGLKQTYLSPSYSGPITYQGIAKIKEFLDGGFPLVCEIDFNPATEGEEMHYVLLMGYDGDQIFCADPWTGQIISLDIYGGAKRAIIRFRAYDKQLPIDDGTTTVAVDSKVFENLVRKSTIYDAIVVKLNVADSQTIILAEVDKFIGYEDAVAQKDKQIAEAQATIASLQKTAADKEIELKTLQDDVATLTQRVNDAVSQNKELQQQLKDVQNASQTPILTGWRKIVFDFLIGRR